MLCLSLTSLEKFIKLLILDYGAPCLPVRIQLSIYKLFKQASRQGSFFHVYISGGFPKRSSLTNYANRLFLNFSNSTL
jgi:hypothetical protein